jgi:hypothetical protein
MGIPMEFTKRYGLEPVFWLIKISLKSQFLARNPYLFPEFCGIIDERLGNALLDAEASSAKLINGLVRETTDEPNNGQPPAGNLPTLGVSPR